MLTQYRLPRLELIQDVIYVQSASLPVADDPAWTIAVARVSPDQSKSLESKMTEDKARQIIAYVLEGMALGKSDASIYLDEGVLGEVLCRALRVTNPNQKITLDEPGVINIHGNDDRHPFVLSFARAMKEFSRTRMQGNFSILARVFASYQRNIEAVEKTQTLNLSLIIPLLKSSEMHARSQSRNDALSIEHGFEPESGRYQHWEVSEGVVSVVALNEPDRFQFVTETMSTESGLTLDALKTLAMNNLAAAYRQSGVSTDYADGMSEITDTGGAAASFILLEGFLEQESMRADDSALYIFSSGVDHLVLMPGWNGEGIASAFTALRTGALPQGDIPPLVYEDGQLRVVSMEDVARIVFSLGDDRPRPTGKTPTPH
jgi:hypothetical protein